jgi:hypothetical protein
MYHDRVTIAVHVHPGAHQRGVGGSHGDALVVRVAARAVHGGANEEVLSSLARAFGLRRHQVNFVRVVRSRDKLVILEGDASTLNARFHELLEATTDGAASTERGL